MKTDLLKEAIAEADMIKKLAVENAKASLNEAFDSKIKSMLAARLAEEAEDLEEKYEEEKDEDKVQGEYQEAKDPKDDEEQQYDEAAGEDQDEAFDIDAILAEMEDGEDDDEEHMKEAKKEEPEESEEGEDVPEDMPKSKKKKSSEEESEEGGEDNMEEDLDLDALIAEMMGKEEKEEPEMEEMYSKKEEEMDEADDPDAEHLAMYKKFLKAQRKPKVEEPKKESIELQEIKRQAAELAQKVNETNLINAKLLYLNKVLRNHTLSEQQKLKVVAAFDKASSVKEAKIVYESINEALNIKVQNTKQSLKESLGFASKASGTSTKREIISEADSHVARWQKLAGIRK